MFGSLQKLILTMFFTAFAAQASAMFVQPDWLDPTQPGVGTNRYAYCFNDPVNCIDPTGNRAANPEEHEDESAAQERREARQAEERVAGPLGAAGKGLRVLVSSATRKAAARKLGYARQRGVADAWKMERQAAINGYELSRDWTQKQLDELVDTGKVSGFEGDHINTVNGNISMAADHRNIQFLTVQEHAARHAAAGGTRTPISGRDLIDRTYGGALPDLATPFARSWPDRVRGLGLGALSGIATGLGVLDYADPFFGPIGVLNPGHPACQTLDC